MLWQQKRERLQKDVLLQVINVLLHLSRDVRKPVFGISDQVQHKPVFGISDQVQHKPGCTATEDG